MSPRVVFAARASELRQLFDAAKSNLFNQPEFQAILAQLRRISDIAFLRDGEPTASRHFRQAATIAATLRQQYQLDAAECRP